MTYWFLSLLPLPSLWFSMTTILMLVSSVIKRHMQQQQQQTIYYVCPMQHGLYNRALLKLPPTRLFLPPSKVADIGSMLEIFRRLDGSDMPCNIMPIQGGSKSKPVFNIAPSLNINVYIWCRFAASAPSIQPSVDLSVVTLDHCCYRSARFWLFRRGKSWCRSKRIIESHLR
jgi:hypothetical protein